MNKVIQKMNDKIIPLMALVDLFMLLTAIAGVGLAYWAKTCF
jgi:hypothetical protein